MKALYAITTFAGLVTAAAAYAPPMLHVEPIEVTVTSHRSSARQVPRGEASEDGLCRHQAPPGRVREHRPWSPPVAVASTHTPHVARPHGLGGCVWRPLQAVPSRSAPQVPGASHGVSQGYGRVLECVGTDI